MQILLSLNNAAWLAVVLYYLIAALRGSQTEQAESVRSRAGHKIVFAVALALIFAPGLQRGPLGWRMLPEGPIPGMIGLTATLGGIFIAAVARFQLGNNWSAIVEIQSGHTLTRKGPYAIVRHPIYSGFLLALLGTSIQFGEVGCFVGFVIAFAAWSAKAALEESFLMAKFGQSYTQYRREVGMLIPFVR